MASRPSIGWIGAGRMGVPMTGLLMQAGYPLLVFTRSAANRQRLVERGARAAASVAECAQGADLVFSSLPDDEALRRDMSGYLARHEVRARVSRTVLGDLDIGAAILSRAADVSADSIVMGAYGHARLRERVLGGATRALLDQMTVPVVMSH